MRRDVRPLLGQRRSCVGSGGGHPIINHTVTPLQSEWLPPIPTFGPSPAPPIRRKDVRLDRLALPWTWRLERMGSLHMACLLRELKKPCIRAPNRYPN
jgi:hypothetical protein